MPLLPRTRFAEVFEPLRGKRIGYVRSYGNVGDDLIEWATFQLLDAYGVSWQIVDPAAPVEVDELVFAGGGNMGRLYQNNVALRETALKLGLPLTILPQSFSDREDRPFKRVFVRERASLRYCSQGSLAPDLALGLTYQTTTTASRETCLFLRRDPEGVQQRRWFERDPIKRIKNPREYLELAAQHEHIITDRLHFAIAGLTVGRQVTLLANSYHKNESMYETWLGDLGCRFAATLEQGLVSSRC